MAQINFNNIALSNATFNGNPINKITFNGQEIWSSGFTVTFAKSGDGIGTMPDPIKVPAGTVITLSASGGIGSGYARYKLDSGSWTNITVNPIQPGAGNFGYFYYNYSWGQSSVTVNSDITLTLTGVQIPRTYSVNAYAQEGLYFSNGGSSVSVSGLSASSIIEFSNSGYCYINGTRYNINRYPDNTPNMYGFDSWGSAITRQEIGAYMQTSSSLTISESAGNKVVWNEISFASYFDRHYVYAPNSAYVAPKSSGSCTLTLTPKQGLSLRPAYFYTTYQASTKKTDGYNTDTINIDGCILTNIRYTATDQIEFDIQNNTSGAKAPIINGSFYYPS